MGEKELREPHLADCKHRDVLAMTTPTRAAVLEMADELRNHARFPHKRLQHEAGQLCRNAEAMLRDLAPPEQPDAKALGEPKLGYEQTTDLRAVVAENFLGKQDAVREAERLDLSAMEARVKCAAANKVPTMTLSTTQYAAIVARLQERSGQERKWARRYWEITKGLNLAELSDYDDELASNVREAQSEAHEILFGIALAAARGAGGGE